MNNPIKFVRLNGLQYNPNRDPQVYRRLANQPFQIQADLAGAGAVTVRFEVDGKVVCEKSLSLPAKFDCEVSFDTAGSRVGALVVESGAQQFQQDLRLDVMDHAWVG